jgi:hypothetical protein
MIRIPNLRLEELSAEKGIGKGLRMDAIVSPVAE